MKKKEEIKFMRRCLDLAGKGRGFTYPNPMVGSVVVNDGMIIGEGYHREAGRDHAEVIAIDSVKDKKLLGEATLYVNLEPCSHYGKTPPCADYIISHSIPRVVIGTVDTSRKVSGKGIERLRNAGCDVISGIAEDDCRELNCRFFTFHGKKRPYIILKWAQSADGYIDIIRSPEQKTGPNWISGKPERVLVHRWRAEEQSILVGAGTVRADNPRLNIREWKGKNPLRIILGRSGSLREDMAMNDGEGEVILFTTDMNKEITNISKVKLNGNSSSCVQIAGYLYERGIQSLLIEGGAEVINHFIAEGLWDEARIFTGKENFGNGIKAPGKPGSLSGREVFSGSLLEIYRNTSDSQPNLKD